MRIVLGTPMQSGDRAEPLPRVVPIIPGYVCINTSMISYNCFVKKWPLTLKRIVINRYMRRIMSLINRRGCRILSIAAHAEISKSAMAQVVGILPGSWGACNTCMGARRCARTLMCRWCMAGMEREVRTIRLRRLMSLVVEKFVPNSSRGGRANAMKPVDLVYQLVGDMTVEDLGPHRPEHLAGQPRIGTTGVWCADALAAQFVSEIC